MWFTSWSTRSRLVVSSEGKIVDSEQTTVIDLALKILSKPDWNYKHVPDKADVDYLPLERAVRVIFRCVYQREIDGDSHGVHWLARTAIVQAISHNGYFAPRLNVWKVLFCLYSFAATAVGIVLWWYLYSKGSP